MGVSFRLSWTHMVSNLRAFYALMESMKNINIKELGKFQ